MQSLVSKYTYSSNSAQCYYILLLLEQATKQNKKLETICSSCLKVNTNASQNCGTPKKGNAM